MTVVIEPMKFVHVDRVAAIEQEVFTAPWSKQTFINEILDNSFASYFIALEDGDVVGYAGIWVVMDEAHVTTLAVTPAKHGQRIGHALLRQLLTDALSKGAERMTLEVRPSNNIAQKLYRQYGFVACGTRPKYYSDEDALIMWLDCLEDVTINKTAGRS